MRKSILTESDKKFIIENYPSKGSTFCKNNLNVPLHVVRNYCQRNKIFVTSMRMLEKNKNNIKYAQENRKKFPEKLKVNQDLFMSQYTPETAYILGLLWADGYINSNRDFIRIEALESDLSEIVNIFMGTGAWCVRCRNRVNRRYQMVIETNNKPLCNFLKKHDYIEKSEKSACSILQIIPDNLKKYWFRGLIDGDGCFYINEKLKLNQFSICSSYEQDWKYCEDYFTSIGVRYKINKRKQFQRGKDTKNSVIRITNKNDIKLLVNHIYSGDQFGFSRKRTKALMYFSDVRV